MANGLEDFLGPELAVSVRRTIASLVQQQAENEARRAEAQAGLAAAQDQVGLGEVPSIVDTYTTDYAMRQLREAIFAQCIAQGAAPDMAWTRAHEAATFYAARSREVDPSSLPGSMSGV